MKYTEKTEEEKKKKIKCKISIFRMEKKKERKKSTQNTAKVTHLHKLSISQVE